MTHFYLDHRLAQPGDVLVSMGRKPASRVISTTTRGTFSHAALCVAPSLLYEATADGVFTTPLEFSCFADARGNPRFAARLEGVTEAKLLRHDLISARAAKDKYGVADDFAELAARYFTRPYSRKGRLLSALPARNPLRRIGGLFKKKFVEGLPRDEDPGVFCSELIAVVYGHLGINLFGDNRLPVEVSPVALATQSSFKEVPEAVVEATPMQCPDEKERLARSAQEALQSRPSQVKMARDLRRMIKENEKVIRDMTAKT